MKLLILNGPRDWRSDDFHWYRGTYRSHPTYCDPCGDYDEINKLFFWFLKEGGELGVVRNLDNALRFACLWNTRSSESKRFDVVEVTDGAELPVNNGRFIGFDLSAGYNNSLVSSALGPSIRSSRIPKEVKESFEITRRNYMPELNNDGLFNNLQSAAACLESLVSLQCACPNLFEGGNVERFQPTAVYILKGKEESR